MRNYVVLPKLYVAIFGRCLHATASQKMPALQTSVLLLSPALPLLSSFIAKHINLDYTFQ